MKFLSKFYAIKFKFYAEFKFILLKIFLKLKKFSTGIVLKIIFNKIILKSQIHFVFYMI